MEGQLSTGTGERLQRVAVALGVILLLVLVATDVVTESEAFTATFVVPVFLVALAGSPLAVMALGAAALAAAIASPAWTEGGDLGTYAIRVGAVGVGTVFALFAARQRLASILAREEVTAALGNLADAVTVQDASGTLVYANRAAAELLGADSPEELLATPPAELIDRFETSTEDGAPLDPDKLPGRRVLRGEPAEPLLVRAVDKATGEERWRMVRSTAIPGPPGAGPRAINVIEDITETKRAEIAQRLLAEAGEELASSLDYETTLRQVARMAVPQFADWCAVSIPREDGTLDQVAIAHIDPDRIRFAETLRERYPSRVDDPGRGWCSRRGVRSCSSSPTSFSASPPRTRSTTGCCGRSGCAPRSPPRCSPARSSSGSSTSSPPRRAGG